MGLISPIDGIYPEDINLSSLIDRVKKWESGGEVIVALKPSIEGGNYDTLYKKNLGKQKYKSFTFVIWYSNGE